MNNPKKYSHVSMRGIKVLAIAKREAINLGHSKVFPEHILIALIAEAGGIGGKVLLELGVDAQMIRSRLKLEKPKVIDYPNDHVKLQLDESTDELLSIATEEAIELGGNTVGTEHLLLALIEQKQSLAINILLTVGVTQAQIRRRVLREVNSSPVLRPTSYTLSSNISDASNDLQREIEEFRRELTSIRSSERGIDVSSVKKLTEIVNNIEVSKRELSASVILPTDEDMTIRLVPSHSLERLEEYRSDEGIANLVAGIFGGGMLGLVVSLVTGEVVSISNPTIVLLSLLFLLTILSAIWLIRIRSRIDKVSGKIFMKNDGSRADE